MELHRASTNRLAWIVAVILCLLFLTGAVVAQTDNVAGNGTEAFRHVACSSDGRTVYVVDLETVYKSEDGGRSWTVVLKKKAEL